MGSAHFGRLLAEGRDDPPLDEAALAIASTLRGDLDEIEWLAALDVIAGECPTPTPEGIARYLADDLGFAGNRAAYYDWRNSCIDRVLSTRVGIPITLSVVMIEVARRLGVALDGVGMPGHFLVGSPSGDVFFDLFHGSEPLDRVAVRRRFEELGGGHASWSDGHLAPVSNREIVVRMLNNLRAIFMARHDTLRLALVMQLRAGMPELAEQEADDITIALAVLN